MCVFSLLLCLLLLFFLFVFYGVQLIYLFILNQPNSLLIKCLSHPVIGSFVFIYSLHENAWISNEIILFIQTVSGTQFGIVHDLGHEVI